MQIAAMNAVEEVQEELSCLGALVGQNTQHTSYRTSSLAWCAIACGVGLDTAAPRWVCKCVHKLYVLPALYMSGTMGCVCSKSGCFGTVAAA